MTKILFEFLEALFPTIVYVYIDIISTRTLKNDLEKGASNALNLMQRCDKKEFCLDEIESELIFPFTVFKFEAAYPVLITNFFIFLIHNAYTLALVSLIIGYVYTKLSLTVLHENKEIAKSFAFLAYINIVLQASCLGMIIIFSVEEYTAMRWYLIALIIFSAYVIWILRSESLKWPKLLERISKNQIESKYLIHNNYI